MSWRDVFYCHRHEVWAYNARLLKRAFQPKGSSRIDFKNE